MCRFVWLLSAAMVALWTSAAPGQTIRRINKPQKAPIAVDGDVELLSLTIKRHKSSDAQQDTDASSMELQLSVGKFPSEELWHTQVRITALAPLEDNTGKWLATEKRLAAVPSLKGNLTINAEPHSDGFSFAVAPLTFDAPARDATKLKRLAGKAIVMNSRLRHLRFMDETAAAKSGKPLRHPLLGTRKLVPTLEFKNGVTKLTLLGPAGNSRVVSIGLLKDNMPVSSNGGGVTIHGNVAAENFNSYPGDLTGDTHLVVNFAEEDKPLEVVFEFWDVELP